MTSTATTAADAAERATIKEEQPYVEPRKPRHTGVKLLGILVVWLVAATSLLQGPDDQGARPPGHHRRSTSWLNERPRLGPARTARTTGSSAASSARIGDVLNWLVVQLQELISIPAFPRPVPEIGWLGVVALAAGSTYAVAGLRSTILVARHASCSSASSGYWPDSMDTLIITGARGADLRA